MIIYAYTMTDDTGFAPAVKDGTLSLACCKTYLRYKVANDIKAGEHEVYIIGLCGKELANYHSYCRYYFPIYIAKITEVVNTKEYFSNIKYFDRADSQYRLINETWYFTKDNPHHEATTNEYLHPLKNPENDEDLYYTRKRVSELNYVLLSTEYACFGDFYANDNSPNVPSFLKKIGDARSKAWRGGLDPITVLDSGEQQKLAEFVSDNKEKFKTQKTIDASFIK